MVRRGCYMIREIWQDAGVVNKIIHFKVIRMSMRQSDWMNGKSAGNKGTLFEFSRILIQ